MKSVRVDIHEELTPTSIKEKQRLNVSVVDYVPSKSKVMTRQSRMNKIYNSRHLLRAHGN